MFLDLVGAATWRHILLILLLEIKILRINIAEMETCKHAWSQLRINEHKEVRAQINHQWLDRFI